LNLPSQNRPVHSSSWFAKRAMGSAKARMNQEGLLNRTRTSGK
jgi:hypothetical protein